MNVRRERFNRAMLSLAQAAVTGVFTALLRGWLLMLAVGVAHHDWTARIPPMGYWTAVLLTALYPIGASTMTTKRGES
ncbi:MAG: hypothetical protein ACEQSX_20475 [Baekduiaceae bacterium]